LPINAAIAGRLVPAVRIFFALLALQLGSDFAHAKDLTKEDVLCARLFAVKINKQGVARTPLDGPFAPLQGQVGMAEVARKVKAYVDEAELLAHTNGRKAREYILDTVQRESNLGVDGFIDPDGVFRPDDSHHKILAIFQLLRQYSIPENEVKWKLRIPKENDFRGRTWNEFAEALEEKGLAAPGQGARRLPNRFEEMADSPMRSSTGAFFATAGLRGTQFRPMAQFSFGRNLQSFDLDVEPGREFSPSTQGRIMDLMFNSAHSRELIGDLSDSALPDQRALVAETLKAMRDRYQRIYSELESSRDVDFDEDLDGLDSTDDEAPVASRTAGVLAALAGESAEPLLPKEIFLPEEKSIYHDMFSFEQSRSLKEFDLRQLKSLLKDIRDDGGVHISRADRKYLKEFRKAVLGLRAMYRLLSDKHKAHKSLDGFTRVLGELNDHIRQAAREETKSKRREIEDVISGEAGELVGLMKDKEDLFTRDVDPVTIKSFVSDQAERLDWLEATLAESDADFQKSGLRVSDYHDIRKRMREYAAFFKVLEAMDPNIGNSLVAGMLSNLNRRMGGVKDGLLASGLTVAKSKRETTSVDPVTADRITRFVRLMRTAIDKIR
jgi:hypothetical protein